MSSEKTAFAVRFPMVFPVVLTFAIIVSFVDRYLPSVLIDPIRRDVPITDLQFSTLQTAFALTYAGATLASGWISDRAHRIRLIVIGVALWALGSAIFGLANSLVPLLAGRVMIGLGEAVLGPAGISLLCDYLPPERRGKAIALTYFGATLGTSLAFSGGGWLLQQTESGAFASLPWLGGLSGWRQVVLMLALVSLPLIPAILSFREPTRSFDPSKEMAGRLDDLRERWPFLWPILLTGLTVAIADFAYTSWQTPLMTRTYGWSIAEAGQSLGLTALAAGTIGAWVGGVLSDRARASGGAQGRISVVRVCALGLLASACLLLLPYGWAAIAAFALWQLVANIAYVACAVSLVELVTARTRALTSSISVALSIGLGLGFGPTSVALINQAIGHGANALVPSVMIVLATMGLGTLLLSSLLMKRLNPGRNHLPD